MSGMSCRAHVVRLDGTCATGQRRQARRVFLGLRSFVFRPRTVSWLRAIESGPAIDGNVERVLSAVARNYSGSTESVCSRAETNCMREWPGGELVTGPNGFAAASCIDRFDGCLGAFFRGPKEFVKKYESLSDRSALSVQLLR